MSGAADLGNKKNAIIAAVVVVLLLAAFIVFRAVRGPAGSLSGDAANEPTLPSTPGANLLEPGGGTAPQPAPAGG